MHQATKSKLAEALRDAVTAPTFAPLTKAQKNDIRHALHEAAILHISTIMNEASEALKNPGSESHKASTRYLSKTIETMKHASPSEMSVCFGMDAVTEAADRVAAMNWVLGLSTSTAIGLLNLGADLNDVLIKMDGSAGGGKPAQLAEALGSTIYEITANAWLYTRGHEWAAPPAPSISEQQKISRNETIH